MKQVPFEFARAAWCGQRAMCRQELEEKKKRIEQKARALHLASLSPRDRARTLAKEQAGEAVFPENSRQMMLPEMEY